MTKVVIADAATEVQPFVKSRTRHLLRSTEVGDKCCRSPRAIQLSAWMTPIV